MIAGSRITAARLLGGLFTLAAVLLLGSCASAKYVPTANEELYGTWTGNGRMFAYRIHKVVYSENSEKTFEDAASPVASIETRFEITGKWKDSEGNVWYKCITTVTGGTLGDNGAEYVWLLKLSKAANVLERVFVAPSSDEEMKNPVYPSTIDPTSDFYSMFSRASG